MAVKEFWDILNIIRLPYQPESDAYLPSTDMLGMPTYDPVKFTLSIHDGVTPGGNRVQIEPANVINLATWLQTYFYTETEVDSLISDMATVNWVNAQGFLTSFTETDPIFTAHAAFGITSAKISNWDTAYGWGNHASAGYLTSFTETDPVFTAHAAYGITSAKISNWDTAYGWGNHASAGYLTSFTETDPVFTAHAAYGITSAKISNWDTAYGWGNHASAGYLTSLPGHTHDDRYYTESEVNSLLSGYSVTSHNHDSRYYTESEVNSLISGMATQTWVNAQGFLTSLPAHNHTQLDRYATGTWLASTSPSAMPNYFVFGTVEAPDGWPNYGTVLHSPVYSSGDNRGAMQMYIPYSPSYGGTQLKYRLGDTSGWGSWIDIGGSGSGGTVTSIAISSSDFSVSGSPITSAGTITLNLASGCVDAANLNNNVISGQTALASGLASTDELFVSDNGLLKRMDVSVLQAYMQSNLTFGGSGLVTPFSITIYSGQDYSHNSQGLIANTYVIFRATWSVRNTTAGWTDHGELYFTAYNNGSTKYKTTKHVVAGTQSDLSVSVIENGGYYFLFFDMIPSGQTAVVWGSFHLLMNQ